MLLSHYQLYFTHNSFVTFYRLTSVACKQLHTSYSITNTNTLINTVNKSSDQLITSFQQSSIVVTISQGASFYSKQEHRNHFVFFSLLLFFILFIVPALFLYPPFWWHHVTVAAIKSLSVSTYYLTLLVIFSPSASNILVVSVAFYKYLGRI